MQNKALSGAIIFLIFSAGLFSFSHGYIQISKKITSATIDKKVSSIYKFCEDSENLKKLGGKESCYASQFQSEALISGPVTAFNILHALQKVDPSSQGCHLIAHGIGRGTFEREPSKWQEYVNNIE